MRPTVGRMVHYYDLKSRGPFAATVTGTYAEDDGVVDIDVHARPTTSKHKATLTSHRAVAVRENGAGWCWPPRVEDTRTNMEKIHDVAREGGLRPVSDFVSDGTVEDSKKGFGRE